MTKQPFLAFIDLLATKQSLDIGHDSYYKNLKIFTQTIESSSKKLDLNDEIYVFSDCAYITFKRIDTFSNFYNYLQRILMAQNLFFRCSVIRCNLEDDEKLVQKAKKKSRDGAKVNGHIFGKDAVKAFLLHESFKGIGSIISPEIFDVSQHKKAYYFKTTHRSSVIPYHAFRIEFDDTEQETELLKKFSKELLRQNTLSRRIGRYYISMLSLWLKSTDFSDITYDPKADPKTNKPLVNLIIYDERFYRNFIEIPGGEIILFTLFSCLSENDSDCDEILKFLARKIDRRKSIRNQISNISNVVMDEATKRKLVESMI